MIIIYLIPSGAYLVTFLLMLGVCSALVENMSAIYIIFILLVMLCPVVTSLLGFSCCRDERDNMITKHIAAAITMITITSVVSTVILFMALKSQDMSKYEELGGLITGAFDIINLGLIICFIIIGCCIDAAIVFRKERSTPMKVAFNHILLTAGCFVALWFRLTT